METIPNEKHIGFNQLYSALGHLDRCVAGAIALEILESCHEETSAPSLAVREHHRKFKLHHHLTNMAHHIPIDIKAPQVVRKMKSRVVSLHQQVTGSQKNAPGNQANSKDYRLTEPILTHLMPIFHFLFWKIGLKWVNEL